MLYANRRVQLRYSISRSCSLVDIANGEPQGSHVDGAQAARSCRSANGLAESNSLSASHAVDLHSLVLDNLGILGDGPGYRDPGIHSRCIEVLVANLCCS